MKKKYPGITYDSSGTPLTLADRAAQTHLDERNGIFCPRGCKTCTWVLGWIPKQARLRGGVPL